MSDHKLIAQSVERHKIQHLENRSDNRFKIVAKKTMTLWNAIKQGDELTIGTAPLSSPFKEVQIEVISKRNRYALFTTIRRDKTSKKQWKFPTSRWLSSIGFKTRKVGSSILIMDAEKEPEIEIDLSQKECITIMAGCNNEKGSGITEPLRLNEQAHFNGFLLHYIRLVEEYINRSYLLNRKVAPELNLKLRPPITALEPFAETPDTNPESMQELMPYVKRMVIDPTKIKKVSFADIGGLTQAKKQLQEVADGLANFESYIQHGADLARGVLLYGPPGSGKTEIVYALVNAIDHVEVQLIHIHLADILSKWVGESEKIMQMVFDQAKNYPGITIMFFDDMEELMKNRREKDSSSTGVVNVMLTNLEGFESSANILVIAATNLQDVLDDAIVRAGRIDIKVECALPDLKGREEIFSIHIKNKEQRSKRSLFEKINMKQLAERTNGFSGADIREVLNKTLREIVKQHTQKEGKNAQTIPPLATIEDILHAIEEHRKMALKKPRRVGF